MTDNGGGVNPVPLVEFEVAQEIVPEGAGSVTLRVGVGSALPQTVQLPLLVGGSATEIQDYILSANPLVLPAGALFVDLEVTLVDDALAEGSETLELRIGAAVGVGAGGDDTHTLIIVDDESALVSDDFNTCGGLGGQWTVVDPLGDATVSLSGVGSGDARLSIAVPGGAEHQMWQTIFAPHALQAVTDTDFEVELGFAQRPANFQIEGLLVRQAANRWLRFDLYGFGGNVFAFAGSTTGTSTAQRINTAFPAGAGAFLRIARAGDEWTFRGSPDGTNWTILGAFNDALTVTGVGPFAGNFGAEPAFTCELDYFFDTAVPIVPEDGSVLAGPAPISFVTEGQGSVTLDPPGGSYTCGDVVTLTAQPAAGWEFQEWSGDLSGTNPVQQLTLSGPAVVHACFVLQTGTSGPPNLAGIQALPGFTDATIRWTTDQPASSRVDFGPTAAYGSTVSDPALVTSHELTLSGLTPGALYHFQVTSANAASESTSSGDLTFTALSGGVLVSDDFNDCGGLDPVWTLSDPLGDAMIELVGAGTDDAWLLMGVPAGAEHQAWNTLFAPTVTQALPDTDFTIDARYDSVPGDGQIVGMLVQQDALRWARFDFYGLGGQLYAFTGTSAGGSTTWRTNEAIAAVGPLYSRVERSGDDWTWSTSTDGQTWAVRSTFTDSFSVQRAGPYVGNFGSLPAHSAAIDFVFDAGAPLAVEDGWVGGLAPRALTLQNTTGGTIAAAPLLSEYHCDELVTLSAQPAAGFTFAGWTGDLAGSANPASLVMSANRTVGALFDAVATPPPVISNVAASATTSSAVVTWTTDVPADSRVDYGVTAALGQSVTSGAAVTQHGLNLPGLSAGTTYFYRVASSASGQAATGALLQVTTQSALGGLYSDDFNDCELDSEWTFLPGSGGGGSAGLVGAGTPDAQLAISLPAGVERQAWNTISAPRVLQAVPDQDFQVELKFDSDVTQPYQIQGLLVLEDNDDWLRFDLYRAPSGTRWFAGSTSGGSTSVQGDGALSGGAPHYLRVTRAGNQWTYEHSADGSSYQQLVSFSRGLSVSSLGPYAGTALGGASPAFTALCDYVFDATAPPANEDLGTPGAYTLSAQVPGGGGSVLRDPDLATYACGASVTLTAVPDAGFAFQGWSGAAGGSANPLVLTVDDDLVVSATFSSAGSAPLISNLQVSPATTSAVVTWDTDQPADSRVDFGLTAAYGSAESSSALVTSHALTLTGLAPGTTYQYRVASGNAGNFVTVSANQQFGTGLLPGAFESDDFRAPNLDRGLWTFTDPEGAADLRLEGSGSADARLVLEIPGGVAYTPWMINGAARVSQPIVDTDLAFEVKFESDITAVNTSTGVYVAQDDDDWVRFDFFYDGSDLNLFAASFTGGTPGDLDVTPVQSGPWTGGNPLYLRIARTGNTWTSEYSFNGANWLPGASFNHVLGATEAGILCGNGGSNLAPQIVAVDYVFDSASPITPEDGAPGADLTAPWLYDLDALVLSTSSAEVRWRTDEAASGVLAWGLDAGLAGTPVVLSSLQYEHAGLLVGLLPGTTYFYQVRTEDAAGNSALTPVASFTTSGGGGLEFPVVDVWYGQADPVTGVNVQSFGEQGNPQPQVNVMGRVDDADEDRIALTVTLEYRLNGGPATQLALGDDRTINYAPWRLANEGDYNVELFVADLVGVPLVGGVHRNTLELIATDDEGHQTSRTVRVDYTPGVSWPGTTTIDWSQVAAQGGDVQRAVQPVDGEWQIVNDATLGYVLRNDPAGQGYDRLVALGELSEWDDYELLVSVTVRALDPQGFTTGTQSHAMGFIMRWRGHTPGQPYPQPNHGIFPLGAIWTYRWFPTNERWEIWINENQQIISQPGNDISLGTTYWYRLRVEGQPGGGTFYGFKLWADGTSEPGGWTFTQTTNPGDPASGSIALFAHHCELLIGDVQVSELP